MESGELDVLTMSPIFLPDEGIENFVRLASRGYFDGTTTNPAVTLPLDLLAPLKIGQRITGSGTCFSEVPNAVDGLMSVYQGVTLGNWEWRGDALWFNGSQNTTDIELRYTGGVPTIPTTLNPNLFATTLIPFLDCLEALSYRCAYIFCSPRLPKGGADEL